MSGSRRLVGCLLGMALLVEACGAQPGNTATTAAAPSVVPDVIWSVDLEVEYAEWLRIPGTPNEPVRRTLRYSLSGDVPVGAEQQLEPIDSEFSWAINCQLLFLGVAPDPDAVFFEGSTQIDGDPPAELREAAEIRDDELLLPTVEISVVDGQTWLLHNLPDVVPFDEVLRCPERDWAYVALRPSLARSNLAAEEPVGFGALAALEPASDGIPNYLRHDDGTSGWPLARLTADGPVVQPVDLRFEWIDVEVGLVLTAKGSVTRSTAP